jgi:hypothetical protein
VGAAVGATLVDVGRGVTVMLGAGVRLDDGTGDALSVGVGDRVGVGDGVGGVKAPDFPKSRPYARISTNTPRMTATQILDTRSST